MNTPIQGSSSCLFSLKLLSFLKAADHPYHVMCSRKELAGVVDQLCHDAVVSLHTPSPIPRNRKREKKKGIPNMSLN
uniref:Uncharacterized protein n=1 Tax=Solanum lycopersicum TaxID=4081 RepID=A0A3Q7HAT8_SOLLC